MHMTFYTDIGLVWLGLLVHLFNHTRNTAHVNYRLQFIITTQLIIYEHPSNII